MNKVVWVASEAITFCRSLTSQPMKCCSALDFPPMDSHKRVTGVGEVEQVR